MPIDFCVLSVKTESTQFHKERKCTLSLNLRVHLQNYDETNCHLLVMISTGCVLHTREKKKYKPPMLYTGIQHRGKPEGFRKKLYNSFQDTSRQDVRNVLQLDRINCFIMHVDLEFTFFVMYVSCGLVNMLITLDASCQFAGLVFRPCDDHAVADIVIEYMIDGFRTGINGKCVQDLYDPLVCDMIQDFRVSF